MTAPKLTLLDIDEKANILFEKLISDDCADSTSCDLPIATYILTSSIIENIDPTKSRELMIRYLYKIRDHFVSRRTNDEHKPSTAIQERGGSNEN